MDVCPSCRGAQFRRQEVKPCHHLDRAPKEIAPGITVDLAVCHGKPVIKATRIMVPIVVGKLAGGMEIAEVADAFGITPAQVRAAPGYALQVFQDEEVRGYGELQSQF